VLFCVLAAGRQASSLLVSILGLKSQLAGLIEPDFGLLDQLLGLEVLTRRQCAIVRSNSTVFERNDAILNQLTTENQCDKFLKALQLTHQQHVVNYITHNGG